MYRANQSNKLKLAVSVSMLICVGEATDGLSSAAAHPVQSLGCFTLSPLKSTSNPSTAAKSVGQCSMSELRARATKGDAEATCEIGVRYQIGDRVPVDYQEAKKLLTTAAESGSVRAKRHLGLMLLQGQGTPRNCRAAIDQLEKAAISGGIHGDYAAEELGDIYAMGIGVEPNAVIAHSCYGRGVEIARQLARGTTDDAAVGAFRLARYYADGKGVEKSESEANRWYEESFRRFMVKAESGEADAQRHLAMSYSNGLGTRRDDLSAVKWYRRAAEQDDAAAQFYLGNSFEEGRGVNKDQLEAANCYKRAAERVEGAAQFRLGYLYLIGQGVEQNDEEAVKWFHKASEQGLASAQSALGSCYETGRGVLRDETQAVKWYRRAAE
ncbi:MAG: sel1 repeat family protein, partial [Cyanobacteria bacterium]|nr:sel1 repeat family protein [Cyanobacteriota bacterium]